MVIPSIVSGPFIRLALPVALVVLGCISASFGDEAKIGALGLAQALPSTYFACLALLTGSFFLELFRRGPSNHLVLAVHLVGMTLLLRGAPGFLEQEPRFATAWLHAGFADQILATGVTSPTVDARFNWPGFFAAAAAVTGAGGLESATPLLRWATVFMVLLYLPPLYAIGKQLTGSDTATWLALWLVLLVNWVGQDYFAPQGLGFVLYLTAIAIIVTFFRDGARIPFWSRLSAWHERQPRDGLPDIPRRARTRAGLIVLLVLIASALAVSHQLSPIVLVLACGALWIAGRSRLMLLPLIAAVLTLGWISVGATPYWLGHLDIIFGGLGKVDAVVSNSVGERVIGSPTHVSLVRLRLMFTAAVWSLMALAALVLWARRRPQLTLAALAGAPFIMLVQNYGNEGVLRIFLFSCPFACMLIARVVVDFVAHLTVQVLVVVVTWALVPVFLLTRYGNESYEQVRPRELEAVRALYEIAPIGSNLLSLTSQVPWRFAYAVDYDYSRPLDAEGFRSGDPAAVMAPVGPSAEDDPGTYLLITTSEVVYGSEALGEPPDWFDKVRPLLTRANGYRLVYQNPDALIYEYEASR